MQKAACSGLPIVFDQFRVAIVTYSFLTQIDTIEFLHQAVNSCDDFEAESQSFLREVLGYPVNLELQPLQKVQDCIDISRTVLRAALKDIGIFL